MRVLLVLVVIFLAQGAKPVFGAESEHKKKTEAHTTTKSKEAKNNSHSAKGKEEKTTSKKTVSGSSKAAKNSKTEKEKGKLAANKKEKAPANAKKGSLAENSKKSARTKETKGTAATNNKTTKRYAYSSHRPASHTQGPTREASLEEIFPPGHRFTDDERQEASAIGLYCDSGDWKAAFKSANEALKRHPERWWLQAARAAAAANLNRPRDVIDAVDGALNTNQGDANRLNINQLLLLRANALSRLNFKEQAIETYLQASKVLPKDPYSRAGAAWLYATASDSRLRNGRAAVELANEAVKLTGEHDATMVDVLAAAYAEQGDFAQAQKWESKAILRGDSEDIPYYQERLRSYQANQPWRETES